MRSVVEGGEQGLPAWIVRAWASSVRERFDDLSMVSTLHPCPTRFGFLGFFIHVLSWLFEMKKGFGAIFIHEGPDRFLCGGENGREDYLVFPFGKLISSFTVLLCFNTWKSLSTMRKGPLLTT
ncbi:hypothetical protein V6N12_001014 [Hibiscus sabdariffa]